MRAIESALYVLSDVDQQTFASESLRNRTAKLEESQRKLTSYLVYSVYRKKELWIKIIREFLKTDWISLEPQVKNALLLGTAGLIELSRFSSSVLVNAVVDSLKKRGFTRASRLVNAVLRKIAANGRKKVEELRDTNTVETRALLYGVPLFAAREWIKDFGPEDAEMLLKYNAMKAFLSFRISPGIAPESLVRDIASSGYRVWQSPLVPESLRLAGSAHPPSVYGFREGLITPQSESSMVAGSFFIELFRGGRALDMCAGRGIKTGQFIQKCPGVIIEAWEISRKKAEALDREMKRLGLSETVKIRQGDALKLQPSAAPSIIMVDAPCSGSGTWKRHPEIKWKTEAADIDHLVKLQESLLEKALEMVVPGGIVVYSTCSLFKKENEQVLSRVLKRYNNFHEIEVPLKDLHSRKAQKGIFIWPDLPWLDGFYIAALGRTS